MNDSSTPAAELLEKRRLAEIAHRPRRPLRDALEIAFWATLFAGWAAAVVWLVGWHFGPAVVALVVRRMQDVPTLLTNAYPWPHLLAAVFVTAFVVSRIATGLRKES